MPVTFQVVGNLADYGNDDRAHIKVRATADPPHKIGDVAIHSNQPETVLTDEDGKCTLTLVSVPGVWYRIQTPYSNAMPTVNLAGYVPDVDDPTTGVPFPEGTVIDLKDVADENPAPGYEAISVASWDTLLGKPTLGTAAATDATDYATAAQGAKADAAARARITDQAEAFNPPLLSSGTGVNPTVVIGYDATSDILYGADRTTNNLSMSSDGGTTWQHSRGMPTGVNHVQLHKVVRFGAHVYLFAISSDGRAGVYRAPAPAAAADLIAWEATRTNLISNPSFEAGTTGWTPGGTPTLTNPTDGGWSGSRYARCTATGTGLFTLNGPTVAVTAGQPFAASAYVRGTPGLTVNLRMTWTGGTGAAGSTGVPVVSATSWQRISYTETVPAGATSVRVDVRVASTGVVVGSVLDVDAVMLETGTSEVGSYTDTTGTRRLTMMTPSTSVAGANFEAMNGKSTAFAAGSSALMLGDYGDFAGGPVIQRSLDGTTWATVWAAPTSRHVHAVTEDPYNPGHWWATIGDGSVNTKGIIRSTDDGATWGDILTGTGGNVYQSVQISFDADRIYFAADHYGSTAFYMDRDDLVIRNLNIGSHVMASVPGGVGGRIVTDLVTTSGSQTVTSASLTATDKGRTVRGDGIPVFSGVSNEGEENYLITAGAGTATLKGAATASATITAVIGGDRFYAGSYMGAVDPATGVFYVVAFDTSSSGNLYGLFAITQPGAAPVLLGMWSGSQPAAFNAAWEVFVVGSYVYTGSRRFRRLILS